MSQRPPSALTPTCPDCGVGIGQPHQRGCDVERCSVCGLQRLSCTCAGHDRSASGWDGEWPGVAECRRRGWYAKGGPQGGWVPCDPDDPDATEDLNRLAYFNAHGVDGLYRAR